MIWAYANRFQRSIRMNRKSMISVILILLLAVASILGLPIMTRSIERRAENAVPAVTATPAPVYDDGDAF